MPILALALFLAVDIAPMQPNISYSQPQIASNGQTTGLVFGSKDTIYYAANGNPVVVANAPVLSLGNHRGPRLAFTSGAIVVTAGVGPADQQYGPNTLRSWRSTDAGKTWSPGAAISEPGGAGMGFQAVGSDGKRLLWAVWLGQQQGRVKLLGARSTDEGLTWSSQRVIYDSPGGNVCECCHPNVAISADGTVHVMFRNSLEGNRDLYLATSKDGERFEIAKMGQGTWPLNACPMDGGGLGEFNGSVVTLWRRKDQLFLARPDGKPEELVAVGKSAAVALRAKGVYAVWSSSEGIMGKTPGKDARLLSKTGAFPAITARGPVVVAWEDGGKIRTERLD